MSPYRKFNRLRLTGGQNKNPSCIGGQWCYSIGDENTTTMAGLKMFFLK